MIDTCYSSYDVSIGVVGKEKREGRERGKREAERGRERDRGRGAGKRGERGREQTQEESNNTYSSVHFVMLSHPWITTYIVDERGWMPL